MGIFEHWPYVNFHNLNLDWIIEKMKNIDERFENAQQYAETATEKAAEAEQSAAAAAESAQDAEQAADAAADSAGLAASSADAAGSAAADAVAPIQSLAQSVSSQISVLTGQMNEFMAAHAGPTGKTLLWSGDAYLPGTEIQLSDSVANYTDFIIEASNGSNNWQQIVRPEILQLVNGVSVCLPAQSGVTPVNMLRVTRCLLGMDAGSTDVIKIRNNNIWDWTGAAADAAAGSAVTDQTTGAVTHILRIYGISNPQTNAEVNDIRVGADGTVYDTAGNAVRGQITALNDQVNKIETDLTEREYAKNRWNGLYTAGFVSQSDGIWHPGGSSYAGTEDYIDIVETPVVFSLRPWGSTTNPVLRYALYDENKTFLAGGMIGANNLSDLTFIPSPDNPNTNCAYLVMNVENAKYMRFSMSAGFFTNQNLRIQIERGTIPTAYEAYHEDTLVIKESALPDIDIENVDALKSSVIGSDQMSNYTATLAAGTTLRIAEDISIRNNKMYHLHAMIDASFDTLYFGHGEAAYSLYFKIDGSGVTFMTNGSEGTVLQHGLTLSTYIDVLLIAGEKNTGKLILSTLGGYYEHQVSIVNGYKGQVFVRPSGCTLTDVTINFTAIDMRQPIWMFGDSYFTHTSTSRWTYYLIEWGFARCLLNAYPGEKSEPSLAQIRAYLEYATPKYIVWCLGMNDPDTSTAVNADWLAAVESLTALCNEKGIELILSTIPNVPSYSNYYKNQYVRTSGLRYIDFAKAVGAEAVGSSWYAGCLSQDETHPAPDGARLLCLRAIQDVPELTLGNI